MNFLLSKIVKLTFAGFILLFLSVSAYGQKLEERIDALINSQLNDLKGPGGVFLVSRSGKPIYVNAFGMANLELQVPLTSDHVFQIGSMTKQFTAVGILLLAQDGLLDVQDPVSKFIPDFPNGNQITIHHLLTHTSGIRDFTKMKSIQSIANKKMSAKEMVDFFKDEPVDFSPGERFDYNNSGYVILGYLIELVSSKTYAEFIERQIFDHIEMNDSYFATDRFLISGRADGYHLKDTGYVNRTVIDFSVPFSSGSLMSTVHDLLKWQSALNETSLLNAESKKMAFTPKSLGNGEKITYGYGWHIKDINGTPSREHGGSIFGFKSMGVYLPSKDIYVVGLTNCDCISPTQLTLDIANLALEFYNQ